MGYNTKFTLKVDSNQDQIRKFLEQYESDWDSKYWCAHEAIEDYGESRKWYEHESDMRDLSLEFPDMLFTLEGEGDEAGDLWIKYFKNGKIQKAYARIEYDEFDESKLK